MAADDIILHLDNVSFAYPFGKPVLECVQFELHRAEKVGLIGDNGSGKTTLLHIVMGLLRASEGEITIFGESMRTEDDFRTAREKIGFLFQNPDDQLFCPTVLEDVAFGPLNLGRSPAEARQLSLDTLKSLNLDGFEDRITYKLSGGEKKLVALATVLVMEPSLLLLDEPTTGLDEDTRDRILSILNSLDISCVIVSHEFDFLEHSTREIYGIENSRIAYYGDSADIHSHPHSHPKGKIPHEHKK